MRPHPLGTSGRAVAIAFTREVADVLVSNAAFQMTRESIEEIPDEEWDRTLKTNLSALFGPGTRERGARRVETYPPDSGRYIAVIGQRYTDWPDSRCTLV